MYDRHVNMGIKNFKIATIFSIVFSLILFLLSFLIGKQSLFLFINFNGGKIIDFFFRYWSHLGDGLIWLPFLVYIYAKKKKFLLFVVLTIVLSSLIIQTIKRNKYTDLKRPYYTIENKSLIHTVDGVELEEAHSFPSGHTGTAFTLALLVSLMVENVFIVLFFLLYAVLVGFARIYLAQHFPFDIAGGALIAVITVTALYQKFKHKLYE